jgi:spore coat polysaccharide biosynthesis protein SpsF (cytidylyltransferase family)
MSTVATIVQARMGSSRLPGKVLETVAGEPVLHWVLERASRARHHGRLLVATSDLGGDDPVAEWCRAAGVECVRGSERDVLDRYHAASRLLGADVVVRVTADCPLLDPWFLDETIEAHLRLAADYVTIAGLPQGLAQETISREALEVSWRDATDPDDREHVITYAASHPELFEVVVLEAPSELCLPAWRITLDEDEDLRLLRRLGEISSGTVFELPGGEIIELIRGDPQLTALVTRTGGSEVVA